MSSTSIYTSPLCSCTICKKVFSQKSIGTHYTAKHTANYKRDSGKGSQKFQLRCSCVVCKHECSVQNISAHYTKHSLVKPIKTCPKCNSDHQLNGKYCSRKCANSKPQTEKSNLARSTTLTGKPRLPKYTKIFQCVVCNKWHPNQSKTCSEKCFKDLLSYHGKLTASKIKRRSKDEIKLYDLLLPHFFHIDHNTQIVDGWDADIIIYDTKTAILWNGPWHYKEMNIGSHSLLQVQTRDKIKTKKLIAAGWEVLVFEDRHFTPETALQCVLMRALNSNQD